LTRTRRGTGLESRPTTGASVSPMFSSPAPAESETVIQKPASADIDYNHIPASAVLQQPCHVAAIIDPRATVQLATADKEILQEATSADHITNGRTISSSSQT
jgi:hypothetical protein